MEVILWYFLFASTTSFAALYEIVGPVLRELEVHNPEDNMIQNKYLSYFVFFGMGLLFAPLLLLPCLVPSVGESFRLTLLKALMG